MATKKIVKKIQYWGVGRRKTAIARVRLIAGGENGIIINKLPIVTVNYYYIVTGIYVRCKGRLILAS